MTETKRERAVQSIVELENRYGQITPEQLVEFAAPTESPLHSYFEWNDETAGHAYRLDQARTLLRSVRVEIVRSQHVISTVRYVRDARVGQKEQGYVALQQVAAHGMEDVTIQAEIDRTVALIERGLGIARALGREDVFVSAIREAIG